MIFTCTPFLAIPCSTASFNAVHRLKTLLTISRKQISMLTAKMFQPTQTHNLYYFNKFHHQQKQKLNLQFLREIRTIKGKLTLHQVDNN